ncbi:MAG: response regulator [Minicystis sp.]
MRYADAGTSTGLLVVEDDPDHREIVREVLEEEGYRVETAAHGRDALSRLLAGLRPDLILLDMKMPVMDGWAFMAELKARAELAEIPVVVTSQEGDRVLNTAPVSAGYIDKPINRSRLLETIACLLWRKRQQSEP